MRINRLNQAQLQYELAIRGLQAGTVDQMRKTLSGAIKLEQEGNSISHPDYPFSYEEDRVAINDVINVAEQSILKVKDVLSRKSKTFQANETRLIHTLKRLDRMVVDDAEKKNFKSEAFTKIIGLVNLLEEKAERPLKAEEGKSVKLVNPSRATMVVDSDTEESEDEEDKEVLPTSTPQNVKIGVNTAGPSFVGSPVTKTHLTTPAPATNANNYASGSCAVPVYKWDLKFTGDKKGMSVHDFLERLTDLCEARGVNKDEIIRYTIDLFPERSPADKWYRYAKSLIVDWKSFVREITAEFEPFDYQEKLLDKIKKRTQAPDEPIGVYLATIKGYLERLNEPLSESAQVRLLMRNIHPFYQTQLALVDVKSIEELRKLCRQLEHRKELVESYHPPGRSKTTHFEPGLDYVGPGDDPAEGSSEVMATGTLTSAKKSIKCFNCGKLGHRAVGCTEPKKRVCYRCKTPGFTVTTCPNCSSKNQGN